MRESEHPYKSQVLQATGQCDDTPGTSQRGLVGSRISEQLQRPNSQGIFMVESIQNGSGVGEGGSDPGFAQTPVPGLKQ